MFYVLQCIDVSVLLVRVATVLGECVVATVTVSLVIVGDVQPVY